MKIGRDEGKKNSAFFRGAFKAGIEIEEFSQARRRRIMRAPREIAARPRVVGSGTTVSNVNE